MDFTLNEEQTAIAELAGTILGDRCTPEALRAHEESGEPYPAGTWAELAKADLLGVALPEAVGGGGYGALEACLVAEQVGRHVAPVPYADTMAAALVLAAADPDAHGALLADVIAGNAVLAVGVDEPGTDLLGVTTNAVLASDDWRLTGAKSPVRWASEARGILVTARTEEGERGVFLVDAAAAGVTVTPQDAMWGLPQAAVELADASAVRVGDAATADDLRRLAVALSCSTVSGVCEGALRLTAAYVCEREQFGIKIGTFQAVGQRMADAYIDTEAVRLTSRQAAWRLGAGMTADDELHIAKFWAADGSHRVVHAGQHLHGGVGMDLDFAIHRYFRWAKVLELQLGSGTEHLRHLGASIAATPV